MITYKTLYKDSAHLLEFIEDYEFSAELTWLVRIYAPTTDKAVCKKIAQTIKTSLEDATIIGCTVGGVIFDGTIYDDNILILFNGFEKAAVGRSTISINGLNDEEIAQKIVESATGLSSALGIIHIGANSIYTERVMRRISKSLSNITFIGGVAGCPDEHGNDNSLVFDENGVHENSICITYISTDYVLAYTNAVVGHRPISRVHTITKIVGNYIEEIDNTPATNWLASKIGTDKIVGNKSLDAPTTNDILLKMPFVLEGDDGASRFFEFDEKQNKLIQHHSQTEEGMRFRIGYISPVKSVEEWQEICYDLQNTPVEEMFCYSCFFRKLFTNNLSKWELKPFEGHGVCGAFMFGEISTKNEKTHLYNGTCTMFTMAENATYINPNINAYDRVKELEEANLEISQTLNSLLDTIGAQGGSSLLKVAIKSEADGMARMKSLDGNMSAFLKQQLGRDNTKLCLVLVDANKSLSEMEIYGYVTQLMCNVRAYVDENASDVVFKFYNFGSRAFFFVNENSVSEAKFIACVKNIFIHFKNDNNTNLKINFAITLKGKNPRELQKYIEVNDNESITELFDCDKDTAPENSLHREFEIVKIIKHAIENNGVVPYFQGIYDSSKNRFFAYESLIRIQTQDGEILTPGMFLDIAKKHNLYLELSKTMIFKVLDLFKNRTEIITMNLSSLDINSDEFRKAIFERLEKMKNPGHFIFELVETEQFARQENLRVFIRTLRQYGCKIAIDDFGSGYSNFIEIGNLEIDYIKINGSLTELLDTDVSYNQILESIFFLSKKMQVELIAECVETTAMQKTLVHSGVRYSQGYLFSKPMPIEKFYVVAEENKLTVNEKENNNVQNTPVSNIIDNKAQKRKIILGGIAALSMVLVAVLWFSSYSLNSVRNINNTFLVEMATNMADKISLAMDDATNYLHSSGVAVSSHYPDTVKMATMLADITKTNNFDEIYISTDGSIPFNSNGEFLQTEEELSFEGVQKGEIKIFSPAIDLTTGREFFAMGTYFDYEGSKDSYIYGIFYTDTFSSVLDLKNFGGEAFYHLCEVDGTPIILSGNNDNLFAGGDMYTFIGSLNITNGHTVESIRNDMENQNNVILEYSINNEQRTAVMVTVPGTDWCVVSILLDDVSVQMADDINMATNFFAISVILIFSAYFTQAIVINMLNENKLKKALESSYYLTNSLQSTIETDTLTNTYSRTTAQEKINEVLTRSSEHETHTLIIADADNFKQINDTYGHQTGDVYLLEFASAIKGSLRTGDILGRFGGDEFIILLNNVSSRENAETVIRRIIAGVNAITIKDVDLEGVGISIGAAMTRDKTTDLKTLTNMADGALYIAKNSGKNTYAFHGDLD